MSSARSTYCSCRRMPTAYTVEQVLADPIQLNSRLGTYTDFVNLLDLAGLALPASMTPDGTPFGVTMLATAAAAIHYSPRSDVSSTPTPSCRWAATGAAQPPLVAAAGRAGAGRDRDRGGRRAYVRDGAQWRAEVAPARFLEAPRPRRTTGCSRSTAGRPRGRACCAWRQARVPRSPSSCGRCRPTVSAASSRRTFPAPLSIGTLTLADGRGAIEGINGARRVARRRAARGNIYGATGGSGLQLA